MSSKGRSLLKLPFFAGAALANAHRFVKFGAADDKVVQAAAGDPVVGVNDRPAKADNPVDVDVLGEIRVTYGAAVTRGNRVKSDANGRAIPANANEVAAGIALKSGVENDLGSVLLR